MIGNSLRRARGSSPALAAAIVFGLSGAGFVVANLVLARAMSPADYAVVSLVVALIQIAMPLGPLGLDSLVGRKQLPASATLLRRTVATSAVTGAAAALVGALLYRLHAPLVALIVIASVAGGANLVASSVHQGARRFRPALALSQNQNAFLAAASLVTLAIPGAAPWLPCGIYAVGYVGSALVGWRHLLRGAATSRPQIGAAELVSLAGLTAVTLVLIQIERLVIPRRLSLDDLALFGVLAAVAASPYRVLQQGVGYTLLPRLRAAATAPERRALLLREAQVSVAATLLASALIWTLSRPVVSWWLAGKYEISPGLLLAAIAAGFAKVASAFATAAATALCTERELETLRYLAWVALAGAFTGCIAGARFGLIGVVGGAGAGWLCFAAAAGFLAAPHLSGSGSRGRPISGA